MAHYPLEVYSFCYGLDLQQKFMTVDEHRPVPMTACLDTDANRKVCFTYSVASVEQ